MTESEGIPKVNFREAQAKNRRRTVVLIAGFILFFLLVGFVIGGAMFPPIDKSDPLSGGYFGLAIFGIVSVIWVVVGWFAGGPMTLAVSRARKITVPTTQKERELFNVVEEMSVAAGLPMPSVHVMPDTAMNAFACGRNPSVSAIAVTSGLLNSLTREELQGVVAHELGHIRNRDIAYTVLLMMLIGVLVMICDLFLRYVFWNSMYGGRRSSSSSDKNQAQIVFVIIGIVLAIIAPILARVIFFAVSRQREYLADATAVELNRDNRGIINALRKLSGDHEVLEVANRATAPLFIVHPIKKFEQKAASAMSTHPPIKDRIARLENMV